MTQSKVGRTVVYVGGRLELDDVQQVDLQLHDMVAPTGELDPQVEEPVAVAVERRVEVPILEANNCVEGQI